VRPRARGRQLRPGGTAPLRALAELRFRVLWRRLRARGGVPELVAKIAGIVLAVPAAMVFAVLAGVGAWHAVRAGRGVGGSVGSAALFFGIWQTWTAVGLSFSDRDMLDLRRFLVYPLPPGRVYGYGLAASVIGDPLAICWCLVLAGAFLGAAVARPGAWLALLAVVYLLFAAATPALVALAQELLARLLRGRRVRELSVAATYMGVAFLMAWGSDGGRPAALHAFRALAVVRWIAYPAALAAEATRALYAGEAARAVPWILALALATAVTAWAAYRLALAEALSGGAGAGACAAGGWGGWRIPGRMAPLLEKETKHLLRHSLVGILALVVPGFAAFVAWKVAPHIPAEAGEVVRALPLLGFALYAYLATQAFWLNAFGGDRGGARLWFLAPVPAADVLVAKNAGVLLLSMALFGASAAALVAVGGAPPSWACVGAVVLHLGVAPWFLAGGNLVSILNPRAASNAVQRGGRLSPLSALAGMAIVSAGAALFGAPVLLALHLDQPWLLPAAWGALGLAGATVYRAALPATARLLARRREALLEAVAGDED